MKPAALYASPPIILAWAGYLDLLGKLVSPVVIPRAVAMDIDAEPAEDPAVRFLAQPGSDYRHTCVDSRCIKRTLDDEQRQQGPRDRRPSKHSAHSNGVSSGRDEPVSATDMVENLPIGRRAKVIPDGHSVLDILM